MRSSREVRNDLRHSCTLAPPFPRPVSSILAAVWPSTCCWNLGIFTPATLSVWDVTLTDALPTLSLTVCCTPSPVQSRGGEEGGGGG